MNFKEIIVTTTDGITKITLNRPDKLNAWTTVMGNEVKKAIEIAGQDKSVDVLWLLDQAGGFVQAPIWVTFKIYLMEKSKKRLKSIPK